MLRIGQIDLAPPGREFNLTSTETSPLDPAEALGSEPGSKAVLLMAYGSPRSRAEILPYYTHMRGGRPPSASALQELERRYDAIGGSSPLQEITRSQALALEQELRHRDGPSWRVVVGMKHSAPFLEDAVDRLVEWGVTQAVGLVLAPHYSQMSVGEYLRRVEVAAASSPSRLELGFVTDWHLDPGYVGWLGDRVRAQLAKFGSNQAAPPLVVFTAHSLPARLGELGDPYPGQLGETAAATAAQARLTNWTTAWQSVARTGEPWLGPELLDVVREAAAQGTQEFLVCACGFTADHLEILYDLDVEAQAEAVRLGVRIARTPMPNADPDFVNILADLAQAQITSTP